MTMITVPCTFSEKYLFDYVDVLCPAAFQARKRNRLSHCFIYKQNNETARTSEQHAGYSVPYQCQQGEPKATQQRIRKTAKAHKGNRQIKSVCDDLIAQLYELPKRVKEGEPGPVANLRRSIDRSSKRLGELLAEAAAKVVPFRRG